MGSGRQACLRLWRSGPPLATRQVASDSCRRSEGSKGGTCQDRFSISRFKLCFHLGSSFCVRLVMAESDQYVIAEARFKSDAVCQSRGFVC